MPYPGPKRRTLQRALVVALTLLATAILPLAARAEEDADSPLRPGAWAAEFELDPSYRYDFGFSSGATISVKRHQSARSALRFGVSAAFNESKDEGERSYERYSIYSYPAFRSNQGTIERHDEYHAYALFLHLQRTQPVREAISIFWELGPSVRYVGRENVDDYIYPFDIYSNPAETYHDERSYVRRSVALDLHVGFEWFFNRRLSLGARVGAWGGYSWGTESSATETFTSDNSSYRLRRTRSDLKGASVQTSPATVTLSAYF